MRKKSAKYIIPQFMLAHFSHHVCTGVLIPVLPLLREGFGLNYFQAGMLVSSFSISYGLGQIPLAVLADRYSRRMIIIIGLISISLTGMGVAFSNAFWQMIPFFVAMGLIGGTYHAPASSYLSQTLPMDIRGRALGLHVTGGSASFLLTPAMALGIATLFHSWRVSFFLLSLPALLVGILLLISSRNAKNNIENDGEDKNNSHIDINKKSPDKASENARVSWSEIITAIGIIVCLSLVMQIVFASVNSYLPLYMVDRHHISPKWAGIVVSLIAGTGIIGAPIGGWLSDRFGRKQLILFSLYLSGPVFFAVTRAPFGLFLLLSLVLYGMTISMRMPCMESLIADVVPVGRRTTVLGVYFFLGMETAGLSTPVIGRFIDIYGLDVVFNSLAALLSGVALIAFLFRKHV